MKKHYLSMKVKLFMIVSLLLMLGSEVSYASGMPKQIPLTVGYVDPTNSLPGIGKNPPAIPSVMQDDYEIRFLEIHPYYSLCIVDEDDEVVYSVAVWSFTTSVVLPSWLSGDYEIQLRPDDNYYLYGYIEL